MYCLFVNVYCHRVATQLQLINISISNLLALLGAHPILHLSRVRVKHRRQSLPIVRHHPENKILFQRSHNNEKYNQPVYIGCPRRNVPDFGRMFLMLKYTYITQNTYIQSWTVTEIMAKEKCGFLAVPHTVPVKLTRYPYTAHVRPWEWNAVNVATAMYSAWNPKDNYGISVSVHVV